LISFTQKARLKSQVEEIEAMTTTLCSMLRRLQAKLLFFVLISLSVGLLSLLAGSPVYAHDSHVATPVSAETPVSAAALAGLVADESLATIALKGRSFAHTAPMLRRTRSQEAS
jgi:hypothetical protein